MNLVLSVEATNRLRAQVGLKLIPGEAKAKAGPGAASDLVQISVSETNKLRARLGLVLIPQEEDDDDNDDDVVNYLKLQRERQQASDRENLISHIQESQQALRVKHKLQKGGILDRLSQSGAALDLDSWLDKIGKETGNKRLSFKKTASEAPSNTGKKESEDVIVSSEEVKISHSKEELERIMDEESVLTLKDSNVLDEAPDELENRQLVIDKQLRDNVEEKGNLGKLVNVENGSNQKRKFDSLGIDLSDDDGDNLLNYDENAANQKKISGFMKRDVSKFKKPKKTSSKTQERRRVFDTELEDKVFKPVILKDDDDDDENDHVLSIQEPDDDLESMLKKERMAMFQKPKIIQQPSSETPFVGEVVDERLEFLDRFDSIIKENESSEKQDDDSAKSNSDLKPVQKASVSSVEVPKITSAASRYRNILEANNPANKNSYGVSSVLNALRSRGASTASANKNTDNEVKLVYTDDDGKILSTAEAFKYMSRKFHGSKKK